MEKFKNFCTSGVNIVFSLASASVALLIIFNIAESYVNITHFNTAKILIFALLIILAAVMLYLVCTGVKPIKRFLSVHPFWTLTVCTAVIALIQVLIFREIYTPFGWDSGYLITIAGNLGPGWSAEQDLYLTWYPNNILLAFIFKAFYKLVGFFISDVWLSSAILSALAVDAGIVFISLTAKRIFGLRTYYITLLGSVLLLAFHPMATVPYSDTMALPFTSFFIYLASVILTTESKPAKYFSAFLAGAVLITGYFIKPTVVIAGIASFVLLFISLKKPSIKQVISFVLAFVMFFAGVVSGVLMNRIARPYVYVNIPSEQQQYDLQVPMTHFIMMGLNEDTNGYYGYFPEDSANTRSIIGKDAKVEYHKEVIAQRLKKFGVTGFIKHCLNKAVWVTTDGTFYYGGEGHFHGDVPKKTDGIGGVLQNFTYTDTEIYQKYFANYMQAVWLLTAIGMAFNLLISRKNITREQNNVRFIAQLAVIGLIMFLMLFEARARYVFLYLPYFLLLAGIGFSAFESRLKKQIKEDSFEKI